MPTVTVTSNLTIRDAFTGPSLMSIVRDNGKGAAISWVSEVLDAANVLCGSAMDQNTVTLCAEMILDRFKFRTTNALMIAVKDGLNSGKIFGKLTYPIISEWLIEHEEKAEAYAYSQHLGTK